MTALEQALAFASRGFYVFPLVPNSNTPAHKGWQQKATRDEDRIRRWWTMRPDYNVGIFTGRFAEDQALCVVDMDVKKGKTGDRTILNLELQGFELPVTLEHGTPSTGRHFIYYTDEPLHGGVEILGPGVDVKSLGGYIVAPGSSINGKAYAQINGHGTLAPVPAWLRVRLGADRRPDVVDRDPVAGVDPDRAAARGRDYLKTAPAAKEGQGGDTVTYKVAAALKDMGCTQNQAAFLMDEDWNDRCEPPWTFQELTDKVAHAFRYGREKPGALAPEAVFPPRPPADDPPIGNPVQQLNSSYAFTPAGGGHIIWETTDPNGANVVKHLDMQTFHALHASESLTIGNKQIAVTKLWMASPTRRTYDGFLFAPQQDKGPRWYNLWRGFATTPATSAQHPAVKRFLEHTLENVCNGDQALCRWLIGYFAHLIQRPWEKPLVALVFKGIKGTGKNALIERIGYLLGPHYILTSKRRYLTGQFNGHLENCLLLVLDEAFWSGDKEAEGVLKDLITGTEHVIEHKGKEAFKVANLTRVAIIGNEDWMVPASADERRFAVFQLGEGRMRDKDYFQGMREGMEAGGYEALMRFLLDFNLDGIDLNEAPATQALVDQKIASQKPIEQWWMECLSTGQIAGGDWGGDWPVDVATNRLRDAHERWCKKQHVTGWMPNEVHFGRWLKAMAPTYRKGRTTPGQVKTGETTSHYHSPGLEQLRADFDKYIGGRIEWPE